MIKDLLFGFSSNYFSFLLRLFDFSWTIAYLNLLLRFYQSIYIKLNFIDFLKFDKILI